MKGNRKEHTKKGSAPKTHIYYNKILKELQPGTQNFELLKYLISHKSITPTEAWDTLGIYRLSGRIYDLRNRGAIITTLRYEVTDRKGDIKAVAKYVLEQS